MKQTELIQALQDKNPQAYQDVLDRWGDSFYGVALRILKDPEKAQEAVQEMMIKMIKNIDKFEGRSSLKTWLYRITVNEALQLQKKELPRLDEPIDDMLGYLEPSQFHEDTPAWIQNPESLTADQEFHDYFQASVDSLPEPLRTTYILRDVEDQSEEDIMKTLKITKSAVKNRAHRARLLMRQKISERYHG